MQADGLYDVKFHTHDKTLKDEKQRPQLSRIGRETHTLDVSVTPIQSTHTLLLWNLTHFVVM